MTKKFSPRKLIEARGLRRREELAVVADVASCTIKNWEDGRYEPDASQLAAIAALTGHPLDFFFESVAA